MPSTVENVLSILYNRKCGAAVMLSNLHEQGQVTGTGSSNILCCDINF